MSSRKHLSTTLIKSNSTISSKTTLQPSACYPKPSAVPRSGKPVVRQVESFTYHRHLHASRIRTDTGGRNGVGWWHKRTMHAVSTRYQNAVYRRECRQRPRSRVSSSLPDRDSSKAGDFIPAAAARTRRLQHTTHPPIVTHTYPSTHTYTRQAFPMPLPTAISPKSEAKRLRKTSRL